MRHLIWLFLVLLCPALFAFDFAECRRRARNLARPHTLEEFRIRNVVSHRSAAEIRGFLDEMNTDLSDIVHLSKLPTYDEAKVISGEKSLLSLGEGNSYYISTLLKASDDSSQALTGKKNAGLAAAHALDAGYASEKSNATIPKGREGNFHAGVFETFRLVDQCGRKIFFDEVVSFYALNFFLKEAKPKEIKQVLVHILEHMAPNGVLRVYPPEFGPNAERVYELLHDLTAAGYVKMFTPQHSGLFIVQRK